MAQHHHTFTHHLWILWIKLINDYVKICSHGLFHVLPLIRQATKQIRTNRAHNQKWTSKHRLTSIASKTICTDCFYGFCFSHGWLAVVDVIVSFHFESNENGIFIYSKDGANDTWSSHFHMKNRKQHWNCSINTKERKKCKHNDYFGLLTEWNYTNHIVKSNSQNIYVTFAMAKKNKRRKRVNWRNTKIKCRIKTRAIPKEDGMDFIALNIYIYTSKNVCLCVHFYSVPRTTEKSKTSTGKTLRKITCSLYASL